MYKRHEIGIEGEEYACAFLEDNGYTIIERNFACKSGEIDIIAFDNNKEELVFCEVKTRTNLKYGNPADAVNKIKQTHIYKTAKYYIYIRKIKKVYIRIDVLEVFIKDNNPYKINHIKQIV